MRYILSCLLITLLTMGMVVNEASAKRFGGGRSFGVQRAKSSLFSSPNVQKIRPLGQKANTNRWGGIIGGLLVGGLLASLFMGHGLGAGLLSWLVVGALLFFLVNLFRQKRHLGMQSAHSRAFGQNSFRQESPFQYSGSNSQGGVNAPAGFESELFLREAKRMFIRLQTAYDQKNMQDLRDFTAPEVFAEIKMQLDERGDEPNNTEVLQLDAQLLDISKQADSYIASVRFTGSLQENNEPLTQLDEIWHFRQFYNAPSWVVGGIQQEVFDPQS